MNPDQLTLLRLAVNYAQRALGDLSEVIRRIEEENKTTQALAQAVGVEPYGPLEQ